MEQNISMTNDFLNKIQEIHGYEECKSFPDSAFEEKDGYFLERKTANEKWLRLKTALGENVLLYAMYVDKSYKNGKLLILGRRKSRGIVPAYSCAVESYNTRWRLVQEVQKNPYNYSIATTLFR